VNLGDLVEFYKRAKARFDEDDEFKVRSRQAVVALQSGNPKSLAAWRLLCATSRTEFQNIYDTLGVEVSERGESFYNPLLAGVVSDLETAKLAEPSEGATVVFLDGYKARDGVSAQPLLVQKSDGGYMYATTDLAAVKQRVSVEKAQRVLYVTDVGQASHFDQVFQVARRAGYLESDEVQVSLEHVPFGLVQGEDGKKFKTRSGETVKLKDLLSEAVRIAREGLSERSDGGSEGKDSEEDVAAGKRMDEVAKVIGIGAVKYADLAMNRESNYRFSYSKMLALNGNTAPYMLYAYARVQGIRRKALETLQSGGGDKDGLGAGSPQTTDSASSTADPSRFAHPTERALAKQLLKLPEVVARLEAELYPSQLCDYLFDTSQRFNQFYEQCPVNKAETRELRASRAVLCGLTADTLKLSLGLLGIGVVDRL